MQIGSIVETVGDFEQLRNVWAFPYPKKGDALTISAITKHPNAEAHNLGIVLLYFDELPGSPGICDKTINNEVNFIELILPDDITEIFEGALKH